MKLISSYDKLTLPDHAATLSQQAPISHEWLESVNADLRKFFGTEFSLWDGERGNRLVAARHEPPGDEMAMAEMSRAITYREEAQFIGEEDGVVQLAIPLNTDARERCVAIAPFLTQRPSATEDLSRVARFLGVTTAEARVWLNRQTLWTADSLLRLSAAVAAKLNADWQTRTARHEVDRIADNLAATYEEISLIYGITQNLHISSNDDETGLVTLRNLASSLPVKGVVIQLLPVTDEGRATYKARTNSIFLTDGEVSITNEQFTNLLKYLDLGAGTGPFVANESITGDDDWPLPEVKQIIIVPMVEGTKLFGWIAAINHARGGEFHTVEASLLSSVGVMLGIHCGNRELYRQQAELLAGVVRALTSAIDAKDPYTCGHSDRVARIAVRLAKELGKDQDYLNTIYMAGLLHDVGKIGIDERVLRKPDKLTPEEYEHIKQHPELGFKILADIQDLRDVLPAVLHHHEQWDGKGYPYQLAAESIPEIARIMAVADAYDAMFSSRPYRPGMPEEKVETILRKGAGQQWDANVVEAYFLAREDIREIGRYERANLTLDVRQWT